MPTLKHRKQVEFTKENFPTGSLLFVGSNRNKYIMNLGTINTNHIAMIVWDNNIPYLVDHALHSGKKANISFTEIVPFSHYSNRDGLWFLARKYRGQKLNQFDIDKCMRKIGPKSINMNYGFDFMYNTYFMVKNKSVIDSPSLTCSEYIYLMKTYLSNRTMNINDITDSYRHLENDDGGYYEELVDIRTA